MASKSGCSIWSICWYRLMALIWRERLKSARDKSSTADDIWQCLTCRTAWRPNRRLQSHNSLSSPNPFDAMVDAAGSHCQEEVARRMHACSVASHDANTRQLRIAAGLNVTCCTWPIFMTRHDSTDHLKRTWQTLLRAPVKCWHKTSVERYLLAKEATWTSKGIP